MSFGTILKRNNRLSLTGVLYEPRGVTQRDCQVGRSLSPRSACYSLCGKVKIAQRILLLALLTDILRSYGGSHPMP